MGNAIVIGVILVLAFIGLRSTVKHFKGEGSCCGGGSVPRQKKKLDNITEKKKVLIEGMTCENCKNRVEESINKIPGAAAKVHLKKQEAEVSLSGEVDNQVIIDAVEKAGYRVKSIQ
ncbi:MAG: heavy metal-associated domain-containing protein [Lachnospiraceae bacterium]|jgi:copper chaperone|nr:heavy metal-associated domain-containing protein [Lachnospiraceae bacterium]